jgi:hypothetical protein
MGLSGLDNWNDCISSVVAINYGGCDFRAYWYTDANYSGQLSDSANVWWYPGSISIGQVRDNDAISSIKVTCT